MQVIYAKQPFPKTTTKSIFLAGPTPRSNSHINWRTEALLLLNAAGYDGTVFVPQPADGSWNPDGYDEQVSWEEAALKRADCIVFWIPRDMAALPGLTTNHEFGVWQDSGKVVLGTPPGAAKVQYQEHYAKKFDVPIAHTLQQTLSLALVMLGEGAFREGGECEVPLNVWKHKTFQGWLTTQKRAGNRLDGAEVLWTFRVGPNRSFMFAWIAHVNVFIASENRNKVNEFVFGRTDISAVVLYHRPHAGATLDDTEVVIIKEFRSPARTSDCFIWEVTAGSSKDSEEDTLSVAAHEVHEEAGIVLDPKRLHKHGTRQVAGTLSVHHATVYSAELSRVEIAEVKRTVGVMRGVIEDSEQTYAHVLTVSELLKKEMTDWATLGMIFTVLKQAPKFKETPYPDGTCEGCGTTEDVSFESCPYASDVRGDDTPVYLCTTCRNDRVADT